jgi:hypothetical protein
MSTMMTAQSALPPYGAPLHRKPLPQPGIAVRPPQPYSQLSPESLQQQPGHSRTRTTSSGIFPAAGSPTTHTPPGTMHSSQYPTQYGQATMATGNRRTLSNATTSTSSTSGTPSRTNSGALRRSSSTRSGNSPSSYVALMRKQKATVWCDRAQYEDPRIVAQQRAAKMRANMEVVGGPNATPRVSTSSSSVAAGVRSKITHRAPKASLYAPVNMAGTGVPMRLSATEVDEGDDEDDGSVGGQHHHRTGSGRSSLGSGRRASYAGGKASANSTPPNGNNSPRLEAMEDLTEESETPVPNYTQTTYFEHTKTGLSGGSGSSEERNFGAVGQMPQGLPKPDPEKNTSDLHRRGSLDERTMTMGNTRLFIANPDLSD